MEWNIFYYDSNSNKIKLFNIFNHARFRKYFADAVKKCNNKEDFVSELKSALMDCFWCRCEWETAVAPLVGNKEAAMVRADPYWQIKSNWDAFAEYCWLHKDEIQNEV